MFSAINHPDRSNHIYMHNNMYTLHHSIKSAQFPSTKRDSNLHLYCGSRRKRNLDHGLAKDVDERLALEAGGSIAGGYDPDDPAPELAGSPIIHVGMGAKGHRRRRPHRDAVDNPRLAGARG